MLGGFQHRPRQLWSVTQTASVTNERAAGITGVNPRPMNEGFTVGYFAIRVTAKVNLPLLGIRIYGAVNVNGFPPVGTIGEALISTILDPAINTGIIRAPSMKDADGAAPARSIILPPLLMLEYDTDAPGATPTLTFVVEACFIGPMIGGGE